MSSLTHFVCDVFFLNDNAQRCSVCCANLVMSSSIQRRKCFAFQAAFIFYYATERAFRLNDAVVQAVP